MSRAKAILIALDQFINAICGGWPDETLSSRAWRWERDGGRAWPRKAIDALFLFDPDHCRESFESERTGRQLPPELRELNSPQ
ncbi:MAG: pseudouridine synthase [Desulfovibrio sp.]|jgi:hypothetical protein|nr:pseudouridine synthase [Desulfovibrio sp.]